MKKIKKPTSKIVNIGLKKDLEEIKKSPDNLLKYYKGGNITDNSIEVWYKEPPSFSSNLYYEDKQLMESDFVLFDKAIKDVQNGN